MAIINWPKKVAYEGNVSIPGGEGWDRAYDLALFEERGNNRALVLLVTINMDFSFKDGDGGKWEPTDKTAFMNSVKTECENAWSNKFRIKPQWCSEDSFSEASVVILIKAADDFSPWQSHWSITAPKVKDPIQCYVRNKSDVRLEGTESSGLHLVVPKGGTKPRRSIVHEFGHMLGYRDEYPNSDRGTTAYVGDTDSMMHYGETVRDRHYVFFADWIAKKLKEPWAVEGRLTLKNTSL